VVIERNRTRIGWPRRPGRFGNHSRRTKMRVERRSAVEVSGARHISWRRPVLLQIQERQWIELLTRRRLRRVEPRGGIETWGRRPGQPYRLRRKRIADGITQQI